MGFWQGIKQRIKAYIVAKASANKMFDILEVRTKEIGLVAVTTETDLRISNTFFLPITIVSIKTELQNRDGLRIGTMVYEHPRRIKGNSEEVLTTTSQISIITSLFQAISTLLAHSIKMRSVGIAQVKILWWVVEIPVDDFFEIHPSKLRIKQPETEEERQLRLEREAEKKVQYEAEREAREARRKARRAEVKEDILKRRYKDKYIPKDARDAARQAAPVEEDMQVEVELHAPAIHQMEAEWTQQENAGIPQPQVQRDSESPSLAPE